MTSALKRVIFWDFPRASWQYDVIVVAILAFIFLTPRELFRDQPRAQSIVLVNNDTPGEEVFYLEPKLLEGVAEAEQFQKAAKMLERRDGKKLQLYRLKPIYDSEKDIKGFMAYTKLVK
ncbi:MAG: hypothetical protein HYX27_09330 [Acidobacteria bacterium]|nr:hypothetical protein [Acidobacteriota bacterium]